MFVKFWFSVREMQMGINEALHPIGPELAEFVNAFIEDSGSFDTLPLEKRRDIENQMNAILPMVSLQR
jgi:hypothetical protein